MSFFSHELSDVHTTDIGENTKIWQFSVVLGGAKIGSNCNINANVFVENDVIIGNNVTIKSGVQIWDGIRLEDNVFIGPNVTFTNDLLPRSKNYPISFSKTLIKKGASIGANSTILAGNTIGVFSMIGAGSLITKSVGNNELWYGSPARHNGYVLPSGEILDLNFVSKTTKKRYKYQNNEFIEND